jgi:hypothetical protein
LQFIIEKILSFCWRVFPANVASVNVVPIIDSAINVDSSTDLVDDVGPASNVDPAYIRKTTAFIKYSYYKEQLYKTQLLCVKDLRKHSF